MTTKKLSSVILQRLGRYAASSDQQYINAAKEVLQELALLGLSRSGFFSKAAFHGGTALRIFWGLERFSEDLDFALITPNTDFDLSQLLQPLQLELESWGLDVEIIDRSRASTQVKRAFLKDASLGAELRLNTPLPTGQKFNVKIELDTNPPLSATLQNQLCEYPTDFYVVCHDEPTLFAGKLHAILCRPFLKGRDWYDLLFYLTRRTSINTEFLANALQQTGPFSGGRLESAITQRWVVAAVENQINAVDFAALKTDVLPFVTDPRSVDLWSKEFFLLKLERWKDALQS